MPDLSKTLYGSGKKSDQKGKPGKKGDGIGKGEQTPDELKQLLESLTNQTEILMKRSQAAVLKAKDLKAKHMDKLAQQYIIQAQQDLDKYKKYESIRLKVQKQWDAVSSASLMQQTTDVMSRTGQMLRNAAANVDPERTAQILEESEEVMDEFDETFDELGGMEDADVDMDLDEDLDSLKAELGLEDSKARPSPASKSKSGQRFRTD